MSNCCTYWIPGWWNEACCTHDKDYWKSGKSRKEADEDLFENVLNSSISFLGRNWLTRSINKPIALVMWLGVRLGGQKRYTRKQNITKIKKFRREKHE